MSEARLQAMQSRLDILQKELDNARPAMQLAEALQLELNNAREKIANYEDTISEKNITITELYDEIEEIRRKNNLNEWGNPASCDD